MSALDIKVAFETRLKAIASPLTTQWENTKYEPDGTPYQMVFLMFADPVNEEYGGNYQENGYFQINLRYPMGGGSGLALTKAQSLREWFSRGLTLEANGLSVTIQRTPSIGPAYIDGDRYCLPVKVYFFANDLS